ncbi:MAG: hypothetical protein FWB93_02460, partial [Oscillospiraceae bacterium]|nr:hypothetical protein [Oscillospiraceae bacterium]
YHHTCRHSNLHPTNGQSQDLPLHRTKSMNNIEKTKRLVSVINAIHSQYSQDYFDTGKVEKINLSRTAVPTEHILRYRLNLHESINDYLVKHDLDGITYYYRVKTSESILDKIQRYSENADKYPVNNWMNDIFGARMILSAEELEQIIELLDGWQEEFGLKNWYFRDKDDYRGLHVYFKNKSNWLFPWELRLWDEADVELNIRTHQLHKRGFAG